MHIIHAYQRQSHRYVGRFKHLDAHRFVATLSTTPMRQTREGNGFDDGGSYVRHVTLPAGLTRRERRACAQALRDTLTSEGCACEHDCCGHSSHSTRVQIAGPRHLIARTTVSFNY